MLFLFLSQPLPDLAFGKNEHHILIPHIPEERVRCMKLQFGSFCARCILVGGFGQSFHKNNDIIGKFLFDTIGFILQFMKSSL
jgi:hypothetical protein